MEKQITILHANDLHGSLNFTVNQDLIMQGGISLLSGYVKKVRRRGPVFFGICGDILQEDIWGSDYKGKNTVELINALLTGFCGISSGSTPCGRTPFPWGITSWTMAWRI